MLHLARPDPEGERPKRAVGAGVGVAADNGLARLSVAQLRPHHVHHALLIRVQVIKRDPKLLAVLGQRLDLLQRDRIGDGQKAAGGRDIVIHGRHGSLRAADFAAREAQSLKSLWAGDFMYEVQVDVEQSRLPGFVADDMRVPYLLKERSWCHALIISRGLPRVQRIVSMPTIGNAYARL